MRIKIISISILLTLFILFIIFIPPNNNEYYVKQIISPNEIVLNNGTKYKINNVETFDPYFSTKNKQLASILKISEEEAFIYGNLAKYWAKNILETRKIKIENDNIIYYKFNYKTKFENSAFSIKDGKFTNDYAAKILLSKIRKSNYMILNLDTEEYIPISPNFKGTNFIVIKKGYKKNKKIITKQKSFQNFITTNNFKIIISDFTNHLKPDRNCTTDMCKEILNNINSAQKSIDIAIYGYSSVPKIEAAIKQAKARGVKIRLVYDIDSKNQNIYPNTDDLVKIIEYSTNDKNSKEKSAIMHNKFYIFDNKIVITGSANLSHTDMSDFNSNAIIVINSPKIAGIYEKEFNQLFENKFHSGKIFSNNTDGIYFSPQNKTIQTTIIPLIRNAKTYIYIPTFIISHGQMVEELILAKQRGVDVKIIADALNASSKYSKIPQIRNAGIPVKIENYAGKMHSKTMIIDDKYLILGSMNFSKSGELKNDENTILIKNTEAAKFYKDFFMYFWNKIPNKWLKFYPHAEGIDSIGSCTDGIDNDYDGLIDENDDNCKMIKK